MPTKVYTHHRNCCCIMPFVGIILYEALNTLLLIAPVRRMVKISAAVYPISIAICIITPSLLELSVAIILLNSVLKIPSATTIKNPWKERAKSCFTQFLPMLAHSPLSIIVAIGIGAMLRYINTSMIRLARVITIATISIITPR